MNDTPAKRFIQAFGTNDPGLLDEIYADDGRFHEQIVGDNTFQMPYLELVVRKIEMPWETPDPAPEILSAGGSEHQR